MTLPLHLERAFARLNMRVHSMSAPVRRAAASSFNLDIATDRHGEYFEVRLPEQSQPELLTLDVWPDLRQLLLMARTDGRKGKFLCGFDERHLFTAAVPGPGVRDVPGAMQALKPAAVLTSEEHAHLRTSARLRRRNAAFVRQGEWFFVPQPELIVLPERVRRNEPLSRGAGSKTHVCAEAARVGGEPVMVCSRFPSGVPLARYLQLVRSSALVMTWHWQQMTRNPELYVRGEVRHKDHATLTLPTWHRVLMNTENEAAGRRTVAFLD
ncbi:hypothetical protein [Deinococcus alpinitundrae]|uniref:hypothetical protein n=1 Tax=Deinococcus alpinitundrae TaxID=468913 RepID=UPI001379A88D|nr:hypothetical protein [Deinococcus alpinitundrae]